MQGLVVVGLIFEEIPNINIKCVKVTGVHNTGQVTRSRSPGQGTCRVSASRRSAIEGLMVEGLTVEDIRKGDVKGVKVNGARNIGQGHPVKVPAEFVLEEKHYARFDGCRPYS